jgi:hypothetical protein
MAMSSLRARHGGRGQGITDIAGGAAAKHRRALEQNRTALRRGVRAAAPGDAAARGGDQSHRRAQQSGFSRTVGADQDRGRSRRQCERDAVEDGHRASDDADIGELNGQVGGRCAHAHPA